ncbi:YlbG family protein [Aneurinibacillus terranovensis]|uniref:YlbG family protein n=1 Tax=Aneurinibacillus terranovensis TaxID=278991 RepID=UPI001FDFD685|nr:DUF2129 domain-containing protein [Aneurinibacillus terranovensis]
MQHKITPTPLSETTGGDTIQENVEEKSIMRERRIGLAVFVKNIKSARNLRKFGNVHFISRRLNYVTMYVSADTIDQTIDRISRLDFVTRVERSHRHEISTTYNNAKPDKAKEFDYKMEEHHLLSIIKGEQPVE